MFLFEECAYFYSLGTLMFLFKKECITILGIKNHVTAEKMGENLNAEPKQQQQLSHTHSYLGSFLPPARNELVLKYKIRDAITDKQERTMYIY